MDWSNGWVSENWYAKLNMTVSPGVTHGRWDERMTVPMVGSEATNTLSYKRIRILN